MAQFLEWNETHAVGVEAADASHKKILDLINAFLTGLTEGKHRVILDTILDQLIDVSAGHFKQEEKTLKQLADRELFIRHMDKHRLLLNELRMLKDGYADAKLGVNDMLPFFKDWIFNHIDNMDKECYKQIQSQQ